MRTILLGNAGAGKSTMARRLIGNKDVPRLPLDEIAWAGGITRMPLTESLRLLHEFINSNEHWVMEGCYGDLVEAALPHCTELRFLNPGVETCVAHCLSRPWEPSKFPSAEEQNAMLQTLVAWVREYETRNDEYGLKRHRFIYDHFGGIKREYKTVASYREANKPLQPMPRRGKAELSRQD
jgi:adenylate kinase family enzyme